MGFFGAAGQITGQDTMSKIRGPVLKLQPGELLSAFINVVGGVRIGETSADLPAVLAVLSSLRDRPVVTDTMCFGELGLTGEIRPVPFGEERLREAQKQGFKRALVPTANVPRKGVIDGIEIERKPSVGGARQGLLTRWHLTRCRSSSCAP
jgi:predicted ATP-dependent serine protease